MNIALSPLPLVGMSTWNVYLHIFSLTQTTPCSRVLARSRHRWYRARPGRLPYNSFKTYGRGQQVLVAGFKISKFFKVFTWSSISSNFGKTLGIFLTIIERADIPDDVCNDYGNIMDVIRVSWCVTCLRWSLTWYPPHRRAGDLHSSCRIKVSFRRQPEQPAGWISCYENCIVMAPSLCSYRFLQVRPLPYHSLYSHTQSLRNLSTDSFSWQSC